jgi:large subunit ribosomal protein L13
MIRTLNFIRSTALPQSLKNNLITSHAIVTINAAAFGAKKEKKTPHQIKTENFRKEIQEKLGQYITKDEAYSHIVPPTRQPRDVGETQRYEMPPKKAIHEIMGLKQEKVAQGAYAAVERGGIIYHVFNAEIIPFGRMCQSIATFLRGKHTPLFRYDSVLNQDVCVVVNADNIRFKGKKALNKVIRYHTGYVGHLKEIPIRRFLWDKPEQLIFRSVSKMMPPNKLRNEHLKNLKIFRRHHDLPSFLPNFETITQQVSQQIKENVSNFSAQDSEVIFESHKGGFDELKHLPRTEEPELLLPHTQRKILYKVHPEDRGHVKRTVKYAKRLKKYKEYKLKRPREFDPLTKYEPIKVQSASEAKRYGLERIVKHSRNQPEEDEDI